MPILAMSAGRVTAIWGNAYLRLADGTLKPLAIGDRVSGGTRIITDDNGLVEISPTRGPSVLLKSEAAAPAVDKVIAAVEQADPLQVPAAGLNGAGDGSLGPGLRVERVSETSGTAGERVFDAAGAIARGPFGSSADQRPLAEPDGALRVGAIEVMAADANYIYFGITLTGDPSRQPTSLKLKVTAQSEGNAMGDAWTGELSYSLDASGGATDDITFVPWRGGTFEGGPGPSSDEDGVATLTLPPWTEPGLLLVRVPVFVETDANRPHVDVVEMTAATQADLAPMAASHALQHGGPEGLPGILAPDPVAAENVPDQDPVRGVPSVEPEIVVLRWHAEAHRPAAFLGSHQSAPALDPRDVLSQADAQGSDAWTLDHLLGSVSPAPQPAASSVQAHAGALQAWALDVHGQGPHLLPEQKLQGDLM